MNSDFLKVRLTVAALRNEEPEFGDLPVAESLLMLADELGLDLVEFVETIPEGADTQRIVDRWLYWLMSYFLGKYDVCKPVAELYRRRLTGDVPTIGEWKVAAQVVAARLAKSRKWKIATMMAAEQRRSAWAARAAVRAAQARTTQKIRAARAAVHVVASAEEAVAAFAAAHGGESVGTKPEILRKALIEIIHGKESNA